MASRSRGKTSGSATSSHSDLTQEDLADEIEPVSDEWAADYEYDLDRRDTMAAGGYALADAEPELFGQYIHHFAWPRISGRKSDLTIAERKGHHRGWISRVVAHRGHVRYRVERHLDPARYWHRTAWTRPGIRPNLAYWLALPHGNTTRNVTIDIDNHGPILATFRRGFASIHPIWPGTDVCPPDPAILTLPDLSVDALEKARRLHITLGSEARWCLSSRSLGFHVIRVLDRARDSHAAAVCMRRAVSKAGLPAGTEVYPWGGHAHRLPFGLDFHSFSPDGELVGGFEDQMRLYLDGRPAPFWDDLLNCLLRHWRSLIEEASWHICGVKTWRNLRGRIESTTKDIDRWRSGSSVAVLADVGRDRVAPPRTLAAMKVADVPDWTTYVEDFKAKPHYWLAMVQDLAVNGLPCHDSIDRAARELGRFLIHVQGLGIDEAADLVWRWAEGKSNGFITRFQSGKSGKVRGQIRRVVGHVAREEDFGGRLARMRDKLLAGRYRNPIDLMSLMACPVDRVVRDLPDQAKIEEEVILVDKNVSNEITEAIWAVIQERMMLSQPRDLRRRPGWWQIVRSVVGKLQAHGGEAPLSKAVQATLGGSAPTVKGVIDKLAVAGVILKGKRRYGKPIIYRLVNLPRQLPEEGR